MAVDPWEGERVVRWLKQSAVLEHQLAPVEVALFAAARLAPDEAVLDVGCGAGPTTRSAADQVGPGGTVTGLDVSADMLAGARAATPAAASRAPITWLHADVVAWDPPAPPAFDVVVSRFGVMFFDDPAAAFARLADATRPGGRLAVATWGRRDESPLFAVPFATVVGVASSRGVAVDLPPDDEGPFSLHDAGEVRALLHGAGWRDVEVARLVLPLPFAGAATPAEAAPVALDFGPTRLVASTFDDAALAAAGAALETAFADHLDADGHVVLGGCVNIITARR